MILVTHLSRSEWLSSSTTAANPAAWWFGIDRGRGWVTVCLLGLEVTATW